MDERELYDFLTTQPLDFNAMRQCIGHEKAKVFYLGLAGEPLRERHYKQDKFHIVHALYRAGRDLFMGQKFPDVSQVLEDWRQGKQVSLPGYQFGRWEIRKCNPAFEVVALRIEDRIFALPHCVPGHRFPEGTTFLCHIRTLVDNAKKLRGYTKKTQTQRALGFANAVSAAKSMPQNTKIRQIAEQGQQELLRLWFGDRHTAAIPQEEKEVFQTVMGGPRGPRKNTGKKKWLPELKIDGMVPVPYFKEYGKTTRFLLVPMEEAVLLRMQSPDPNFITIMDIAK